MIEVALHLCNQSATRCDDLLQQVSVCLEHIGKARQFGTDLVTYACKSRFVVQHASENPEQLVEQLLMVTVCGNRLEKVSGKGCYLYLFELRIQPTGDEFTQMIVVFERCQSLRSYPYGKIGQA